MGEHWACKLALTNAADQVHVVADCASVVVCATQGPTRACAATQPQAAIWRQIPWAALRQIHKIKAHRTIEQVDVADPIQLAGCHGNDIADRCAKAAVAPHEAADVRRAEQEFALAMDILRTGARAVSTLPTLRYGQLQKRPLAMFMRSTAKLPQSHHEWGWAGPLGMSEMPARHTLPGGKAFALPGGSGAARH